MVMTRVMATIRVVVVVTCDNHNGDNGSYAVNHDIDDIASVTVIMC